MAKGAGGAMIPEPGKGTPEPTALIRSDIERKRDEMSRTVNEIEERLSPARLKEQVASVTAGIKEQVADLKQSALGEYHEVKDHVKDDLQRELGEAKQKVGDEVTHVRAAVREATVGRVEHMVQDARDTVTEAGTSIVDTIKANPIPAALIGVGLGWLLMSARSNRSSSSSARTMHRYRAGNYGHEGEGGYGYGHGEDRDESGSLVDAPRRALRQGKRAVGNAVRSVEQGASQLAHQAQNTAHDLGEGVSHFAEDAGHRVAEVAGDARDAAMQLADQANERGRRVARRAGRQIMRAERGIETTLRENPLALGAVALAIGAAIGLSLPSTHVEDEWMGEVKERLVERAEGVAGEVIQKAEETVGQLAASDKDKDKDKNKDKKAEKDARPDVENGLSPSSSRQG